MTTGGRVPLVVVMGVSGAGKSSVGRLLAAGLGVEYVDGDDFHSEADKAGMRAGRPLTDERRRPWLLSLAGWLGWPGTAITSRLSSAAVRAVLRAPLRRAASTTTTPRHQPATRPTARSISR